MDNSVMDNTADQSQSQQEVNSQSTEKMIPQSQVNEIVGRTKREAAERAVEDYKRQQSQSVSHAEPRPQEHSRSAYSSLSEEDVKRMAGDEISRHLDKVRHEAQERANVEAAHRVIGTFKEKILAGKNKYDDFESVVSNVEMQHYPSVVQLLAEHVDNAADVLYHLSKNRSKLYQLESTYTHNASDGIYEIKRLSDSIKANEQNSQMKNANAPLSQPRPSNNGTGSGVLSFSDLKRKYKG